jgi:predicted enzyme related to lactoylglutathione lyase
MHMPETAVYAPGTPAWADLSTSDPAAGRTFYSKLFGWQSQELGPEAGGYVIFKLDGKQVAALGPVQNPGQPSAWSVYIATDDARATAKRVRDAGGTVALEPMEVMDQGSMAVFQDPIGAFISVWQPAKMKGFDTTGQPNSFAWAELNARGVEKTKAFYKKVFGWGDKSSPMGEGQPVYTEWQLGGESIGGGMEMGSDMPSNIPPFWLVYFGVADPDATARKATELGGKVNFGPADFPGGRFAVIGDPQGATFGILRMSQ